ncbi:thiosulfate sulfurtransferase [Ferroplasma acidarmanus Fer1]|uniref:Thiosulfate sulfurtransferase n=2 Tax=Ferroplasma TaxID=74968 RepID=S0ARP7_FERAC|nr:thiosulfate sulfurtransferase [Ferroplasma acidarmanus Fer1]
MSIMNEISRRIEAILFSSKEPVKASEIAEYLNITNAEFIKAIKEISRNYENIESSLIVGQFGNSYKIKLSEEFVPVVDPFIEKEFTEKQLAMLSYIYKMNGEAISGNLRDNFGYAYKEDLEKLKKGGMVSSRKYRNTHKYKVTTEFHRKFNINKRTLRAEEQ